MRRRSLLLSVIFTAIACHAANLTWASEDGPTAEASPPRLANRIERTKFKSLRALKGNANDVSGLKRMTWRVGELTREALVSIPPSTDKKVPLVFAFHGHGGTSTYGARNMGFHTAWPEAICVYPQGLPTPVPLLDPEGRLSGWQKFSGDQEDRDLRFFDAMLATFNAEHQIDTNRIYSAGHSNGAFFTYLLWGARGESIAAIGPIAGLISQRAAGNFQPIPIFHVAGEADPIVRFRLQESTISRARQINGCDAEGKAAGAYCTEYASSRGTPVVTFIHPSGHEIPDGAVERMTRFFKDHPKE